MKIYFNYIKREIKKPNKYLRKFFHLIYGLKNLKINKNKNFNKGLLVWDIRANPITFDFLFTIFYVYSSLNQRHNITYFDLVIYHPDNFKLKPFSYKNYNSFVSSEELYSRIDKMILPFAKSFNCIKKISLINNENDIFQIMKKYNFIFPRNYNPKYFIIQPLDYLTAYKFLKCSNFSSMPCLVSKNKLTKDFNIFDTKLKNSEYITFTLRDPLSFFELEREFEKFSRIPEISINISTSSNTKEGGLAFFSYLNMPFK